MVWAHYLLRNSLGGTSGVRIHGVRQTAGSNLGCLRQRSSLALRRPLQQLQPQLKLYLPEQICELACFSIINTFIAKPLVIFEIFLHGAPSLRFFSDEHYRRFAVLCVPYLIPKSRACEAIRHP